MFAILVATSFYNYNNPLIIADMHGYLFLFIITPYYLKQVTDYH